MRRKEALVLWILYITLMNVNAAELEEKIVEIDGNDSIFQSSYNATSINSPAEIFSVYNSCASNGGNFILGRDEMSDSNMKYSSLNRMAAVRFLNVSIPYNSVIKSARLKLTGAQSRGSTLSFSIYAQSSPNAGLLPSNTGCLSGLTLTSAFVPFTLDMSTPPVELGDLSSVIQEIVLNPGWRKGNPLTIVGVLDDSSQNPDTEFVVQYAKRISLEVRYTYDQCINVTCTGGKFCNDTNVSGLPEWECVYNLCVLNPNICPNGYTCTDPDPRIVSNTKEVDCTFDECSVNNGGCDEGFNCTDTDIHTEGGVRCWKQFYPSEGQVVVNNSTKVFVGANFSEEQDNSTAPPEPDYMSLPFRILLWNEKDLSGKNEQAQFYFTVGPFNETTGKLESRVILDRNYPILIYLDLSVLQPPISFLYQKGTEWLDATSLCGGYQIRGSTLIITMCQTPSARSFNVISRKLSRDYPFINSYLKVSCASPKGTISGTFNNIGQTQSSNQWTCSKYDSSETFCIPTQILNSPLALRRPLTGTSFAFPSVDSVLYNCSVTLTDFSKSTIAKFTLTTNTIEQYYVQKEPINSQYKFVANLNPKPDIDNIGSEFALVETYTLEEPTPDQNDVEIYS